MAMMPFHLSWYYLDNIMVNFSQLSTATTFSATSSSRVVVGVLTTVEAQPDDLAVGLSETFAPALQVLKWLPSWRKPCQYIFVDRHQRESMQRSVDQKTARKAADRAVVLVRLFYYAQSERAFCIINPYL